MRAAARDATRLWIGVDLVAANMARASARARANALFVLGSAEALPEELAGVASLVTVNLPWGSLLRAVAAPDVSLLNGISAVCAPQAALQVTFSVSTRDVRELTRLGLADPDPCVRLARFAQAYRDAGFELTSVEALEAAQLREMGTTWAKRLWRDPERKAWRIVAVRVS